MRKAFATSAHHVYPGGGPRSVNNLEYSTRVALNIVWVGFFLLAFLSGLIQWVILGNGAVFADMLEASFDTAKTGFEIALYLTGGMCFWLGIMRIGEQGGIIPILARLVAPLFRRLFPDVPADHPATANMLMNIAANLLGLDNAATPLGLKAMRDLQTLNPSTDSASNAQIMFLVLNTSGLTIIPVSVMIYRAELGAANPADIFLPILLATSFSTLVGLLAVAGFQRLKLWDPVVLLWLGGAMAVVGTTILLLRGLPQAEIATISRVWSGFFILSLITGFIVLASLRRINVYECFIEGAKDGFQVAVGVIPYLIAILVAVAVLRASGALDVAVAGMRWAAAGLGLDTQWVEGMPTAVMKPLSGSGARGMMVDAMKTHGADSFIGRLTSTMQGATDTTFYVLAVYFGAVGIRKTRHALVCGLVADVAGIVAAIAMTYLFFG